MTHWKKLLSQHLIATARSVNRSLEQKNIRQLIEIPKSLHSEKQMMDLSNQINNCIQFPHLLYMQPRRIN